MKIICTKCNEEKDSTHFRKDQHNSTGYHCHCNICYNKTQRKYYSSNLKKVRDYANDYYSKNAKRISEMRKARRMGLSTKSLHKLTEINKDSNSDNYYNRIGWKKTKENTWRKRGIKNFTYDQFEEMKKLQNNKCYICNDFPSKTKGLCVDHDHKTGKVRKLLCNNCNNGIGKLKDSIELLKKAINYLKEHE